MQDARPGQSFDRAARPVNWDRPDTGYRLLDRRSMRVAERPIMPTSARSLWPYDLDVDIGVRRDTVKASLAWGIV